MEPLECCVVGTQVLLLQSFVLEIFSSDLTEGLTQDNLADGFLDAPPPCPLLLENLTEDGFVG